MLPRDNKTRSRKQSFLEYYTLATTAQAKAVFKSFMEKWGYAFPEEWGETRITQVDRVYYNTLNNIRKMYWKRLKHGR